MRKGNKDRAEFLSPFQGKEGKAASTVSKVPGVRKVIFGWMHRERNDPEGSCRIDPCTEDRKKKVPVILTVDEVTRLLDQPSCANPKEIRDKAMLELLYATGIRVTELVSLKLSDVNMAVGFITCRDEHKERMIPFGHAAKNALAKYLEASRGDVLKRE